MAGADVEPPLGKTVRQFKEGVGQPEETAGKRIVAYGVLMPPVNLGQVGLAQHLQEKAHPDLRRHGAKGHAGQTRKGLVVSKDAPAV